MNDSPGSRPRSPDPVPGLRVVALSAAILGVLVLLAAAFVLSYPGIHQLARTAGMSVTLARLFPVIFDALLVVAIAAVLSLHGAGWWRRGYSWLITLLLLAAMAAGGVLHEVHPHIPHRPAAITAAVLPWALLLIAFSLLLSMLRQFRQARLSPAADLPAPPQPQPARRQPAQPRPGPASGWTALLAGGTARIVPAQPSTAPAPAPPRPAARPPRPAALPSPSPRRQPGPGQYCPPRPPGAAAAHAGACPRRPVRAQPGRHQGPGRSPSRHQANRHTPGRRERDQHNASRHPCDGPNLSRHQANQHNPGRHGCGRRNPSRHQARQRNPGRR